MSKTTVYREYNVIPATGGFGEWQRRDEPSECYSSLDDLFQYAESWSGESEFESLGIKNISGLIKDQAGYLLFAWHDEYGNGGYSLVEEIEVPVD